MVDLGTLPGLISARGLGVNRDGSVVVGSSATATQGSERAFRWTAAGGMVSLGPPVGAGSSEAFGVSADGLMVVGRSTSAAGGAAYRWTSATGMVSIGALPGGDDSSAQAVSGDGLVIAGLSRTYPGGGDHAFRWTMATGPQDLGTIPNATLSYGVGVSADGTTIVGTSEYPPGTRAFRWTAGSGIQQLDTPQSQDSFAWSVSGDGSVAVGWWYEFTTGVYRAAMWRTGLGGVDLNQYLPLVGATPEGWQLTQATGISADGSAIVGRGFYHGIELAWLVTGLPASPPACYANCDASTTAPALNVLDFVCFLNKFAAADPSANCDGSTTIPVLNVLDFTCFLNRFAAGCS